MKKKRKILNSFYVDQLENVMQNEISTTILNSFFDELLLWNQQEKYSIVYDKPKLPACRIQEKSLLPEAQI